MRGRFARWRRRPWARHASEARCACLQEGRVRQAAALTEKVRGLGWEGIPGAVWSSGWLDMLRKEERGTRGDGKGYATTKIFSERRRDAGGGRLANKESFFVPFCRSKMSALTLKIFAPRSAVHEPHLGRGWGRSSRSSIDQSDIAGDPLLQHTWASLGI